MNSADSQDRYLRLIDDRRGRISAEQAEVGDRKCAARDFIGFQLFVSRPAGEVLRGASEPENAQSIRLFNDRDNQAPIERDCHADIEIMMVDDILAFERGIDHGKYS